MKLAEALSIRADLQNRIDQLKSRLKYSAKVQEGDQPSEDVNELYKELDECLSQFEGIVYRINRTNMQTAHEGETLTRMVDVGELRRVTDNYSKQLRNLDMKLQSLNWSVDLV